MRGIINNKKKFRYTRKLILIVMALILVLGFGSGANVFAQRSDEGSSAIKCAGTQAVSISCDNDKGDKINVVYNGNGNTSGRVPIDWFNPYNTNETVTVLGNSGNLAKTGFTFKG